MEDPTAGRLLYRSAGRSFSGAFARPRGSGPFPAALVLHGAGGFDRGVQSVADWLTDAGYVTLAPDYYAPLGMTGREFDGRTWFVAHTDDVREDLARGLDCLRSLAYVDPARVAVVGFSLGGYLAFVLATRPDVKAVVAYFPAVCGRPVNGCPSRYQLGDILAQFWAPVLIHLGDADTRLTPADVIATHDLLRTLGKSSELVVYPRVGHSFANVGAPEYDAVAAADAQKRTLGFLKAAIP